MPHCVIELSSELAPHKKDLMAVVFKATSSSQLFKDEDIKVRVCIYDDYAVGLSNDAFVHVAVSILSGRTPEKKRALSERISDDIKLFLLGKTGVSISVDILEMDKESYQKGRI
jgi:5-carboxymethyl-2-hydroxymuconate isomerase